MSGASIHDSRKHPICPPFYGEAGPAYTRVFRTDFVANLWSEVDEAGHSLAEHILGLDEGSPGNPIAGVAAYQAKARRLRNTRSKKVFTHLRKHIEHVSFRAAMNDQAVVGNGLAALALADQWFSGETSNLKLEKQNAEWQNVKLAQFGIHPNSIRMPEQHLQTLNSERPAGHVYNNNQVGARLLACLTFPDTLQSNAMKEMHSGLAHADLPAQRPRQRRLRHADSRPVRRHAHRYGVRGVLSSPDRGRPGQDHRRPEAV